MARDAERITVRCLGCGHLMSVSESNWAISSSAAIACSRCGTRNGPERGCVPVQALPVPEGQISVANVAARWGIPEARVREAVVDGWICYTLEGHLWMADVRAVEEMGLVRRWRRRVAAGEAITPVIIHYVRKGNDDGS